MVSLENNNYRLKRDQMKIRKNSSRQSAHVELNSNYSLDNKIINLTIESHKEREADFQSYPKINEFKNPYES